MRILHVITQARGGPVDHAVDVAVEQARRGHEVHLAGPAGHHADAAAAAGVQRHDLVVRTKTDVAGARRLATIVRAVRPDVLHLQDRRAGLAGRPVAAALRVASVYTLHGVPDPLAPLVPGNAVIAPARRRDRIENLRLERGLARTPHSLVVTPCAALARYARDHVGVPAERVRVVHNGVADHWLAAPGERLTSEQVRALWLGVMAPVKRVPQLVDAVARVPGLRLHLVGDGPERGAVESAIERAGIGDRVRLAGFVDDPRPLLRDADLLVLPSAAEACPMAILQAMACGLPVVASRAGGIAEVVRHEVDGLLVATGDDDALTAALTRLTADADLRARLGASARARVLERFTVGDCADGLHAVYAEVAR